MMNNVELLCLGNDEHLLCNCDDVTVMFIFMYIFLLFMFILAKYIFDPINSVLQVKYVKYVNGCEICEWM